MRKLIIILVIMAVSISTAISQTPQGSKGIVFLINSSSLDFGFKQDKIRSMSFAVGGYYFITKDVTFNLFMNTGYGNSYFNLGFISGFGFHPKNFLFRLTYEGGVYITQNKAVMPPEYSGSYYHFYGHSGCFEFGYTFFVSEKIFIEPSIYYMRGINYPELNRIGVCIGLGIDL